MAYGREDSPSSGRPQGSSLGGSSRSGAGGGGGVRNTSSGTRESQGSRATSSRAGAGPSGGGYGGGYGRSSPEGGGGRGSPAGGSRSSPGGQGGQGGSFGRSTANAYQQGFANSPQRMMAVSRGPGLLTSLQSLNPRAQARGLISVGLSLGQKMGLPESSNVGIGRAHQIAKTAAGELGKYGQLDYDAATRTMTNRMDLLGGPVTPRSFDRIMEAYDANRMAARTRTAKGLKQTKGAYQGFQAAEPGTPNYQKGLYSIANAMSPYSEFSLTAPPKIQAATHYYSGPRTQPYQQNFAQYGPHKFGSPDYSTGQVQMARNNALGLPGASPPTQFAGRPTTPVNIQPASYTSPPTPRAKPQVPFSMTAQPRPKPILGTRPKRILGGPVRAQPVLTSPIGRNYRNAFYGY